METLEGAPEEVMKVHSAMVANAKEAGQPDDCVFTSRSRGDVNAWVVADNYERWGFSMVYREGQWFYRSFSEGEDRPMPNGFREAMANAECAYTG